MVQLKILYIYRDSENKNGAFQVMNRNLKALKKIVGDGNVIEYPLPSVTYKNVLNSIFCLGSYGIDRKNENIIIQQVKSIKPDYVFLESSSFGSLCKKIKTYGFRSICFAHNLDTKLCKSELSSRNPFIAIPKYLLTRLNEKRTARYTDILICLTARDSKGFKELFNRQSDSILPITFPIRDIRRKVMKNQDYNSDYFLFVGSNFFPNVEGIVWFIKNVAPLVNKSFRIVGSCCDNPSLKHLPIPQNVTLVGYTDDIENEYMYAIGVITPIFKGSGMKTKTIEALSYGKSIFGTSEAFTGINTDFSKIGALCNTADEFITALQNAKSSYINKSSQKLFEEQFSDMVFTSKLEKILEKKYE